MDGRDYREYRLNNGLLVALERAPSKTIAGSLGVNTGTVDEKPGREGTAHFLEHVLMTSSTQQHSSDELREAIGSFGYYNAGTSAVEVVFDGKILPMDLTKFLEVTSAIAFSSCFDQEKIKEERSRVLREIAGKFGQPSYYDWKRFSNEIYGKEHPISLEVLGASQSVNAITREDLREFHSKEFAANNMELVLAGDLPSDMDKLIRKYFGDKPSGNVRGRFNAPYIDRMDRRVIHSISAPDLLMEGDEENSNSEIWLNVFVPPRTHPDRIKLGILTGILGIGSESYIFKEVSQAGGLSYDIRGNYNGRNNIGQLIIQGRVLARKQEEALDKIFQCFRKIQDEPLDESLFLRRKRLIQYGLASGLETNYDRVSSIKGFLEHGITDEQLIAELEEVKSGEITEVARKYLPRNRDDNYALMIRDPLKGN